MKEYKTKSENKSTTTKYKYFLKSNFVDGYRLFALVYSNQDNNSEKCKTKRYLSRSIFKNYNIIINRTNFYDRHFDSNIKQYKEIRKLSTWQGEDYTTGCLLGYEHIKNHYRLITIGFSRKK